MVSCQRLAEKVGSNLSSLITDLPGNVVMAVSSMGTVNAVELSEPYGQMNYSWGTMPTAHTYTGQRLESQSGLLYYNFRWYDPLAGVFVRTDTRQTNAQGFNPYASVNDNPETKNDPSGHRYVPNLGGNGTPPPAPGPDAIYQWCLQDAQCNQTEADYSDEIFSQQLQDAQGWLLLVHSHERG